MNHKKELLRGLWVGFRDLDFPVWVLGFIRIKDLELRVWGLWLRDLRVSGLCLGFRG